MNPRQYNVRDENGLTHLARKDRQANPTVTFCGLDARAMARTIATHNLCPECNRKAF